MSILCRSLAQVRSRFGCPTQPSLAAMVASTHNHYTVCLLFGVTAVLMANLGPYVTQGDRPLVVQDVPDISDGYETLVVESTSQHNLFWLKVASGNPRSLLTKRDEEKKFQGWGYVSIWALFRVFHWAVSFGVYIEIMNFREPGYDLPQDHPRWRDYASELYMRVPYISAKYFGVFQSRHTIYDTVQNCYGSFQENFYHRMWALAHLPDHCYPMCYATGRLSKDHEIEDIWKYVPQELAEDVIEYFLNYAYVHYNVAKMSDGSRPDEGADVYDGDDDMEVASSNGNVICELLHDRLPDAGRWLWGTALQPTAS